MFMPDYTPPWYRRWPILRFFFRHRVKFTKIVTPVFSKDVPRMPDIRKYFR